MGRANTVELWGPRIALLSLAVAGVGGLFDEYVTHLMVLALIYALLASGLDVAFGGAGQLLLCQSAFFGFAAYTSALLTQRAAVPVWLAPPAAAAATAALGILTGWIASRTSGHYFAMFTLSVSVIFHQVVLNWESLTQGALGLRDVPSLGVLSIFGVRVAFDDKRAYVVLCAALLWLAIELASLLRNSRLGRLLASVREDEIAAGSLGIEPVRLKILAVAVSAAAAGVAGPLYAHYVRVISPADFTVLQSVLVLLMVITGGSNSPSGPFIGALVVTLLPEYLRAAAGYRWVAFGTALIACVFFLPGGIVRGLEALCRRLNSWNR